LKIALTQVTESDPPRRNSAFSRTKSIT